MHLTYQTPWLSHTAHCRLLVVSPCASVANWKKTQLAVGAQDQERIVLHIMSLRKDSNSKFKVWFLLNAYHFQVILSQTTVSQGPSLLQSCAMLRRRAVLSFLNP